MNTYKLRAETVNDLLRLTLKMSEAKVGGMSATIDQNGLPDCEFEISTRDDLEKMRSYCREIPDGHVMVQTIRIKEEYTGKREYSIH